MKNFNLYRVIIVVKLNFKKSFDAELSQVDFSLSKQAMHVRNDYETSVNIC